MIRRIKPLTCQRCGHTWIPRKAEIRQCAKCKSAYFETPREARPAPASPAADR
jgi:predicted Zn-ribbon and HTH transcriptional regulator